MFTLFITDEVAPIDPELGKASCGHQCVQRNRRLIGVVIPALVVQFVWVCVMVKYDLWYLFPKRYALTIAMVVASILAGMFASPILLYNVM